MIPSGKSRTFFIVASSPLTMTAAICPFSMLSCRRMIAISPSLISGSIESPLTRRATNSPFFAMSAGISSQSSISSMAASGIPARIVPTTGIRTAAGARIEALSMMSVSPSKYSGVTWNFSASVVAHRQSIFTRPLSHWETAPAVTPSIEAISFCLTPFFWRSSFKRFKNIPPF